MSDLNPVWILKKRPHGDDFEQSLILEKQPLPDLGPDQVQVRQSFLSMDPAMRIWMSDREGYIDPVPVGGPMSALMAGVVEQSTSANFKPGDVVAGQGWWAERSVLPAAALNPLPRGTGAPVEAFLGILGATGLTAYFGLYDVGQPKAGETVVTAGAAGAVGSAVGQLAKIKGCRAVGIVSSEEKAKLITETFGFDAAVNYKAPDFEAQLAKAVPDGIDVYFENVGGAVTEAVMEHLNMRGRVPVCGIISTYNRTGKPSAFPNVDKILMKRARVEGFLILDFFHRAPEALQEMIPWFLQGKLKQEQTVVDGIENVLKGFRNLFTGGNMGKQLIKVGPDIDL